MKCDDCNRATAPRASVRARAVDLATHIAAEDYSPAQRDAFACFGLLLLGELATRCERCAMARIMDGITAVATMELQR